MAKCRKALAIFLAVLMFVSVLPISTIADDVKTTYNIIVNYMYQDGKQAANPYTANIAEGQAFKATVQSPVVVGYEPNKKAVEINIPAVTESVTYTVTYSPAAVEYTVKHYQQNVDDDKYTLAETEPKTGLTESAVGSGLAKSYDGFTALFYDTETKIAADGSTVVEVYYDRNYYMLSLNLDGGYGAEPVYARYGALVDVPNPTKPGYNFAGWTPELPTTMPFGGGSYTAQWTAGQATYLVQYWQENANDDGYSYVNSEEKNAPVGNYVSGSDDKNYVGFHYDHADKNILVNGDGTSVVNVYYKRNTYTLTFKVDEGKFVSNWKTKKEFQNVKFGKDTSIEWSQAPSGYLWHTTKEGNTFYTAAPDMPNNNLVVYGKNSKGSSTVHYYEDGTTIKIKPDLKVQTSNWTFTEEDYIEIPGFTYKRNSNTGTDYNLYYTRNKYKLDFNNRGDIVKSEEILYDEPLTSHSFDPNYPTGLEPGDISSMVGIPTPAAPTQ